MLSPEWQECDMRSTATDPMPLRAVTMDSRPLSAHRYECGNDYGIIITTTRSDGGPGDTIAKAERPSPEAMRTLAIDLLLQADKVEKREEAR